MEVPSDDALSALLDNIRYLTKNAESLYNSGSYALAVHVSILSIEESAKYLIVFCRSHIPDEIFRKRFQHINKHTVSIAPWFLAGKFTAFYIIHVASQMQTGDDEISMYRRNLLKEVSQSLYRTDPESIAQSILGVLRLKDEDRQAERLIEQKQRELDRLSSVYVDISDDLKILASPRDFDREKAKRYLDEAYFCQCVSQFIGAPSETIDGFVEMLPPVERQRMKREAEKRAHTLISKGEGIESLSQEVS